MNPKNDFSAENKKRAAFKRFSQMGVAGVAALSMTVSAFTAVSVKHLPEKSECRSKNEPCSTSVKLKYDKSFVFENERFNYSDSDTTQYSDNTDYGNYGNYGNHYGDNLYACSNYSNYSNNYSDACN